MKVFRRLPPPQARLDCALTIGNFDGVHLGHQALVGRLVALARAGGLASCVLTFEPHPREFFATTMPGARPAPARISTLRDKLCALRALGVDRVCVAHFNAGLASMPPEAFAREVLLEGLQARRLLVGDDFRFGARRAGDLALLERTAAGYGASVEALGTIAEDPGGDPTGAPTDEPAGEPATDAGPRPGIGTTPVPPPGRISSSAVRAALERGDFDRVHALLGRPYALSGRVVHGRKLGRTLGFPTLNLRFAHGRPALTGIFVVRVRGLDGDPGLPARDGVASLGTRPAVESDGRYLLEVHVPRWQGDAYGKLLEVEFVHKLRSERPFASLEALTAQIHLDVQHAHAHFQASSTAPASVADRRT
ncbi:MAG: riboflavin kinase [Lautropia sp.]